ncbi:kinase-like domain-containing protein [Phialemonium atrogriseum]|uniref:EKC/KEOPS complex subunit BUD32 n=1 Tax=Phialemonium atrogriseum TaxID=1093897 RepID=A0AAJ0FMM8_9PEZI|nr:kinase-like domain-containing protein [Phialemonium atrogriseum]KAK1766305.1 kinase-like domain-containing protein [Phialemonium atrogriseum]
MPYELLGLGATSYVTTTDNKTVLKGHQVWKDGEYYFGRDDCEDDLAREATIYKHLGDHPQILRCFGLEQHCPGVHSLRLELAALGCVRQFIEEHADEPLPLHTRLRMTLDVVTGVDYLHSKGVQYCDMSCRNLFLFDRYRVKLGDFGASLLEGYEFKPTFCEEIQYELPLRGREFKARPPIKRELFALGSAIYEITMWKRPFQGIPDEEVEARYAREEFPSLVGNMAGTIIRKCWDEEFDSAKEVLEALAQLVAFMGALEFKTDDDQLQAEVCIEGSERQGTTMLCTIPA